MLIHSADISLFQKHLTQEVAEVKRAAGLASEAQEGAGAVAV